MHRTLNHLIKLENARINGLNRVLLRVHYDLHLLYISTNPKSSARFYSAYHRYYFKKKYENYLSINCASY